MRFLRHIPLLVGVTLSGCGEEPSFRVRWTIDDSLANPVSKDELETNTHGCASVGLLAVRTVTRDAFGVVVDNRTRPCSDAESPEGIAGPTLPDGPYTVEVRGVRRDGVGWTRPLSAIEELEPNPGCVAALDVEPSKQSPVCGMQDLACDCAFIQVAEGRTILLDDIVIDAPPQCQDGVDNDNDGLVDAFDPACRVSSELYALESTVVVANAQLAVRTSFLDRNPVATCSSLGVSRVQVSVDDQPPVAAPLCSEVIGRVFQVGAMVTPGTSHTVDVVGVSASGQERTVTKSFTIDVPPTGGGRFELDVDFAATDFLEPIVGSVDVLPEFSPFEGAGFTRECVQKPNTAGSQLELPELRVRMLGARGRPLSTPAKLEDGTPLDGESLVTYLEVLPNGSIRCTNLKVEPLVWGEYFLEVEALSAEGDVCFSNVGEPALLAPGEINLVIPRVFPLAPSCRDCTTNADCTQNEGVCDEGLCRQRCFTNPDCPTGVSCIDNMCLP